MSSTKLPISLGSYLILSVLPKLMEKNILGKMYIRLGRVLTLSIWLYETGAILGLFWKEKIPIAVKMFEVEEKRDKFTHFWYSEAKKRLELYGGQPQSFPIFIGETDLKLFDGRTLQELLKIGNKKLFHEEGQRRLKLAELSLVESIMFGSIFPDLTRIILENQYEKANVDLPKEAKKYGKTLLEKPYYHSSIDREKDATMLARNYVGKYFPELMDPLGLTNL